jgi:hypothetical protein
MEVYVVLIQYLILLLASRPQQQQQGSSPLPNPAPFLCPRLNNYVEGKSLTGVNSLQLSKYIPTSGGNVTSMK